MNIAAMQTLGLSGEGKKSDGWIKSLLWPTVENIWDVDYLGQQGFWICLVIGVFNFVIVTLTAFEMPFIATRLVMLTLGIFAFFVYWVGGMGVREHSFSAAVLVFAAYAMGQLAAGQVPSVLPVILGAVLLSNVRATFLASRWKTTEENEDRPTRFSETFRDKLVDKIPPKAWPILKIPFYFVAALFLSFLAYTGVMTWTHRHAPPVDENSVPSAIVVAPSDRH